MCQSMVDIQPAAAEIRRGKKRRRKKDGRKETIGQNIMAPLLHRAAIISHLALSLHSSNEPGELSEWPRHDGSTIDIATGISIQYYEY